LEFKERRNYIIAVYKTGMPLLRDIIVPVYTGLFNTQENLDEFYQEWIDQGYEGQMVRNLDSFYKVDGRSDDLLKRKDFHDAEFKILDVIEGEGTNKGIAGKVIIDLSTHSGMDKKHLVSLDVKGTQDA